MSRIFVIGSTGHIGGAVIELISIAYPQLIVTALVRDDNKADRLKSKYPQIRTVIGDLDSAEVLESCSKDAEIVINTGPDHTHESGIASILKGLHTNSKSKYYIHTAGAALIWDEADGSVAGTKVWDDVDDIETITSMPDEITHSITDKMVFAAASSVNVAIISPVVVYGVSPSLGHPLPLTLPELLNAIKSVNSGWTIGAGKNISGYVHVLDLARLYVILVSHALTPSISVRKSDIWGPKAYYFGSSEELSFFEYMSSVVKILEKRKFLKTDQIQQINVKQAANATGASTTTHPADTWANHIVILFGCNMRVRSTRAHNLGWKAEAPRLKETLEEVINLYLESVQRV